MERFEKRREREVLQTLFATRGRIEEAAAILGVSPWSIRRYLRRRDFCRSNEDEEAIRPKKVSRTSPKTPANALP